MQLKTAGLTLSTGRVPAWMSSKISLITMTPNQCDYFDLLIIIIFSLTNKKIPFCVQISLISQAALHYVKAVVAARFHCGDSTAVGTVHHLHQSTDAP